VRGDKGSEDNFFLEDQEVVACVPLLAIGLFLSFSQFPFNECDETDKGKIKSSKNSKKKFCRAFGNSNHYKESFIQGD
jgi:hypothetical protein